MLSNKHNLKHLNLWIKAEKNNILSHIVIVSEIINIIREASKSSLQFKCNVIYIAIHETNKNTNPTKLYTINPLANFSVV